jgi:hypothetical protein
LVEEYQFERLRELLKISPALPEISP